MAEVCIILLQLEGALQSWGEHSRFDYRDSAALPTKSAIVGMIGCAMGLRRGLGADIPKYPIGSTL